MSKSSGSNGSRWPEPAPIRAVIFDLHSTLVDQGDAEEWLDHALAACGHTLAASEREELVGFLDRIWENARIHDPDSLRDLSPQDHYRVFHLLLAEGPGVDPALGDALYDRLLDSWHAYDDAAKVMRGLQESGVCIAVLSNVGVDVTAVLEREGLLPWADVVVLSCQIGSVKPDASIFEETLRRLGSTAAQTLMVGDSGKDDAGAAHLGIRTLILPRTSGPTHGLNAVSALVTGVNAQFG